MRGFGAPCHNSALSQLRDMLQRRDAAMMLRWLCLPVLLLVVSTARADQPTWGAFLEGVYEQGRSEGISEAVLVEALGGIRPIDRVLELDRRQPEGTVTFDEYMASRIPPELMTEARRRYEEDLPLLTAIGDKYGVDPEFIVALWGLETRFGTYTGGFDVVNSLATLAWDPRRSDYFRGELMRALHILDQGHISHSDMKGSWAGAMGQCQFMPSSFMSYAVDWDLDGHKDIWTTRGDVFASAANYLSGVGWREGLPWGGRVKLPAGLDTELAGNRNTLPLSQWQAMGVTFVGNPPQVGANEQASLILPGGPGGPAYLVFDNYRAIMKWNRSDYFGMSVVTLADAVTGR